MYVHKEPRENAVDVPAGQIKDTHKDDKKSRDSPALQPKSSNNIRSVFSQKQGGLKESRLPLKRADSNITEWDDSNKKVRRQIESVEKTIRKGETEQEWTPDVPFDLSVFGKKFYEQENIMLEQTEEEDSFPSLTPRTFSTFHKQKKEVVVLPPFKQEEQEVVADFPTPSTVEYGPQKEIELPLIAQHADIIQFDHFSAIADLTAYETLDDEEEIIPVFQDDDDYFYLAGLFKSDEEDLYFPCHARFLQEEEEDEEESICVPFDNYFFDVNLVEC
ncbi:hypothetical protein K501DRAFT_333793 [Backusella circina FSU 941]|nr:hypothetical protein K501DRAFT_333793 [Backusella circina FSU 941]